MVEIIRICKESVPGIMTNALALERHENGKFKYWIGKFAPKDAPVPAGFDSVDFDAGTLAAVRLKGPESEIWGKEVMCYDHIIDQSMMVLEL